MEGEESQPFPLSLRQVFHDAVNGDNDQNGNETNVSVPQSADFFDFFWIFGAFFLTPLFVVVVVVVFCCVVVAARKMAMKKKDK